jgi:hypothetical protein
MKLFSRYLQTGLIMTCLLLVVSCGGQSFVYQPASESPPGPGLFSGEDGEFTLISTGQESKEDIDSKEEVLKD